MKLLTFLLGLININLVETEKSCSSVSDIERCCNFNNRKRLILLMRHWWSYRADDANWGHRQQQPSSYPETQSSHSPTALDFICEQDPSTLANNYSSISCSVLQHFPSDFYSQPTLSGCEAPYDLCVGVLLCKKASKCQNTPISFS